METSVSPVNSGRDNLGRPREMPRPAGEARDFGMTPFKTRARLTQEDTM